MAPRQSRQERQLERQRGAGTRQVKNLDFGFVLPGQDNAAFKPRLSGRARSTPRAEYLAPQRSSRRTPTTELPPQKPSHRTPASRRRAQSQAARTPARELLPQRSTGRSASASVSRKRVRSASPDLIEHVVSDDVPERSTKKQRIDEQPGTILEEVSSSGKTAVPILREQNGGLVASPSGKKRKKRKSIGQQSMRKARPAAPPPQQSVDLDTTKKRGRPRVAVQQPEAEDFENTIQDQLRRENADLDGTVTAETDAVVLQSVEPTVNTGNTPRKFKRKKRVSIGQQVGRKARPALQPVKEEPSEGDAIMDEIPPTEAEVEHEESEHQETDHELTHEPVTKSKPISKPDKPKRKKRKSIGQQRPKRPPASSPAQPSRSDQRKRVQKPPSTKPHIEPIKPPPRREAPANTTQASASTSDAPRPARNLEGAPPSAPPPPPPTNQPKSQHLRQRSIIQNPNPRTAPPQTPSPSQSTAPDTDLSTFGRRRLQVLQPRRRPRANHTRTAHEDRVQTAHPTHVAHAAQDPRSVHPGAGGADEAAQRRAGQEQGIESSGEGGGETGAGVEEGGQGGGAGEGRGEGGKGGVGEGGEEGPVGSGAGADRCGGEERVGGGRVEVRG